MLQKLSDLAASIERLIIAIGAANIALALLALNLVTFAAFGIDKARAINGKWRIQESTLLGLSLIGGTFGAYAGRWLFRHKTRKLPFNVHLFEIVVLQVLIIGCMIGWKLAA